MYLCFLRKNAITAIVSAGTAWQEFAVEPQYVMKMWQAHKVSHDGAIEELYRTRGAVSLRFIQHIQVVQTHEKVKAERAEQRELSRKLQKMLRPRIEHPVVNEWLKQYSKESYGVTRRFKFLLLRGCSQAGKTVFAENLLGEETTIVVNCQGLGADLPSMRHLERSQHKCIVFDEIHHSAVLNNKAFFQAGKNITDLSQSKCGAFRYSVFPYQIALICTSNRFATTVAEGLENEEDEDWMQSNCKAVTFGKGETCFLPGPPGVSNKTAGAGA